MSIHQSSVKVRLRILMRRLRYFESVLSSGNMGFDPYQKNLLDKVRARVNENACVLLQCVSFYGTNRLIGYCKKQAGGIIGNK